MANKVFFHKAILNNVFVAIGRPVPFEHLSGNQGVISLDSESDAALITELEKAAQNRRGGISKITQAAYDEKKKAFPLQASVNRSQKPSQLLQVTQPLPKKRQPQNGSVAANDKAKDHGLARQSRVPVFDDFGRKMGGPTIAEWTGAGYKPEGYPPSGYAPNPWTPPAVIEDWMKQGKPHPIIQEEIKVQQDISTGVRALSEKQFRPTTAKLGEPPPKV